MLRRAQPASQGLEWVQMALDDLQHVALSHRKATSAAFRFSFSFFVFLSRQELQRTNE